MVGDIEAVVDRLNQAGVRYLIVGGVAVVLHGHLRTTADLDLVVALAPDNLARAIAALSGLGYRPRAPVSLESFADPATRESWRRERGLEVLSLWSPERPTLEVDLFAAEPFDFDQVYSRALHVRLERASATVIPRGDLIALKKRAGRPSDLADVQALEALAAEDGHEDG